MFAYHSQIRRQTTYFKYVNAWMILCLWYFYSLSSAASAYGNFSISTFPCPQSTENIRPFGVNTIVITSKIGKIPWNKTRIGFMAKPGIKKTRNGPKQGISWTPLGEIDFTASQEIDFQSSYAIASHKFKLRYFVSDQPTENHIRHDLKVWFIDLQWISLTYYMVVVDLSPWIRFVQMVLF